MMRMTENEPFSIFTFHAQPQTDAYYCFYGGYVFIFENSLEWTCVIFQTTADIINTLKAVLPYYEVRI